MLRGAVALAFCLTFTGCTAKYKNRLAPNVQAPENQLLSSPILLPTGAFITPLAAEGARFQSLNPGLPSLPDFIAGQAVTAVLSPNGGTLLVLTSGYNRNNGSNGRLIASESTEYVFIFDASVDPPAQRGVLQVGNTFDGIAWTPSGDAFLVSGGVDDKVHIYRSQAGAWAESIPSIALAHAAGLGLEVPPQAAGIAVTADGSRAVVANFENDSASVLDLNARAVVAEVELRPGRIDPAKRGVAGGEFPLWVVIRGNDKAYISSSRDREVVGIDLTTRPPRVVNRIAVAGQPNRMLLNRAQTRLFVSNGNSDLVSVIDTATDRLIEEFPTVAPRELFDNRQGWKGANPNSLALSPDERVLYVTNGGTNSLALIRLGRASAPAAANGEDDGRESRLSRTVGLIPTGWYPNSVAVSRDGGRLFIVNGKSMPGPNPGACRDTLSPRSADLRPCAAQNRHILKLEKAGLLSLPVPSGRQLVRLTRQVGINNHFGVRDDRHRQEVMQFLRSRIHHVIYVIKENRTYDQVLGDLGVGNGDPTLTLFPEAIAPNHHALARQFVTLDAFFDTGEASGLGWNWTTAGRTTDLTEKTQFLQYADRGLTYDWEGTNRHINVGLATVAERQKLQPLTPDDPDLLPGAIDVMAPEAPGETSEPIYLWDAALRRGLTVRNYGVFGDLKLYSLPDDHPKFVPIVPNAAELRLRQFFPTKAALQNISDPYFRGFDQKSADYYNFKEWEREFDNFVASGKLPSLELVRFPHDHFGDFGHARYGVNTPEKQMADNDYALGLLVDKIAHSPYADDTLIFVIEDDAQDGPDHVDAHRSIAYVIGPYVRQRALVSRTYSTVNMVRTIEEVLGLEPMGLPDGLAEPMADVFETTPVRRPWTYNAIYPQPLLATQLPRPKTVASNPAALATPHARLLHDSAYWERESSGQDFSREDAVDSAAFNRALWRGIKGEHVPYPIR